MTRRDLISGGVGVIVGTSLTGCGAVTSRLLSSDRKVSLPATPTPGSTDPDRRLLDRISFGAKDTDLAELKSLGKSSYLERELASSQPEDLVLTASLRRYDVTTEEAVELMDLPRERVIEQLQGAAIMRAVYSKNQLFERMVDFWSNHFNVFSRKGDSAFYKGVTEERVIRKHALGNFKDLLTGITHSPSMLIYLDNDRNRNGHPNENLARELLELHTMGVHGGYTQEDIQEVARCLSGWRVENRFGRPRSKFWFDDSIHDHGGKSVLGHLIPAYGGQSLEGQNGSSHPKHDEKFCQMDAERVIDILAAHPSTAKFIATKMVRYFVGTEDADLITKAQKAFSTSKGDIKSTLKVVLESEQLIAAPNMIRRPFEYICSSLRVTNARTDAGKPLQNYLRAMGQPLYEWPMPDGYPVKTQNWLGSMLPRWNFAIQLCENRIGGTSVSSGQLTYLGRPQSPEQAALYLASPDFQWM